MSAEVSTLRLNILRAVYLLIVVLFGSRIWPTILNPNDIWDPLQGVAFSFWGAFTLLSILGVWQPLKMLPLLFVQLTYKVIWMLSVGLQLWSAGQIDPVAAGLIRSNIIGIVIDLLVIPWPYVWVTYVLNKDSKEQRSYIENKVTE